MSAATSALSQRWQQLDTRERVLVSLCGVLLLGALIWWLGIAPALKNLREARQAAPVLDAQLATMRAQAAEAANLKGQRAVTPEESQRMLESSVKQSLGAGASLVLSEGRASLTLRGVSADALAQWLQQARSNARVLPTELRLQKSTTSTTPSATQGATPSATSSTTAAWDGTMVLSLPK
jgi:general secretion pathway protein M